MGSDMMVALGQATADKTTLFALNSHSSAGQPHRLVLEPGRGHVAGERVQTQFCEVPQCRQTWTVLGYRPDHGWGYQHGINEHRVAVGCSAWRTIVRGDRPGLAGTELVRLVLERATSALQAEEVLTDLIRRHGQGSFSGSHQGQDHVFLLADPGAAFVLEAAGPYWALQEIGQVRAVSDVGVIRQDWDRLASGLADFALHGGHHPDDGSKVDFAGAVSADPVGTESALRRWGRATLLLEGQNGHIDIDFLRRVLGDHYDGTRFEVDPFAPAAGEPTPLCRHDAAGRPWTQTSFLAELSERKDQARPIWHAFGPPCLNVYFPIFLPDAIADDDFPAFLDQHTQKLWERAENLCRVIGQEPGCREQATEKLAWLQGRFDEEAAEFGAELPHLRAGEETTRQIRLFLQRHAERFEDAAMELMPRPRAANTLAWRR